MRNDDPVTYVAADNFEVTVTSYFKGHLRQALELIFSNFKTVNYYEIKDFQIIFYWFKPSHEGPVALPFPFDAKVTQSLIEDWIKEVKYSWEPDIDGSCSKGFTISNKYSEGYESFRVIAT